MSKVSPKKGKETKALRPADDDDSSTAPGSSARKRYFHPTIEIENAYKHHGLYNHWSLVLENFSMTAYSGQIYCLLGPHGSGKSTVVNVILGVKRLNHGNVHILGVDPMKASSRRVGFCPQKYGLYQEFTVHETLRYYASLLNLSDSYVDQRITALTTLLTLPSGRLYIKYCTESTKRQISFAVALLHEPELLVLDEPTAGVDPVVSKTIWQHIKQLAYREDKTILITTQYCGEAKQADRLGIMRNGSLQVEGNLNELLTSSNEREVDSLYTKTFLTTPLQHRSSNIYRAAKETPYLSHIQSEGFTVSEPTDTPPARTVDVLSPDRPRKTILSFLGIFRNLLYLRPGFKRMYAILLRDLLRCLRSFTWLAIVLLSPVALVLIFGYTIRGSPQNVQVAVVENSKDCGEGCQIINHLGNQGITQVSYKSREEAIEAVKNLEADAALLLKDDNTARSAEKTGDELDLYVDGTSPLISQYIRLSIQDAYNSERSKHADATDRSDDAPVLNIERMVYGSPDTTFSDYMIPGVAATLAFHFAAYMAAITLIQDRVDKITDRDYLAGVRITETALSLMVVYGLIVFIQLVLIYLVALYVFHMPSNGSIFVVLLLMLVVVWCGIFFGIFVSMVCRTPIMAACFLYLSFIVSLILCGLLWPLKVMPGWVQATVLYLPLTSPGEAARNVLQKGISISHQEVWMGLVIPGCWMVFLFLLSALFIKVSY